LTNYVDIDTFVQQYESTEDEYLPLDTTILGETENDEE
jgi:hypothetical protein